MHRAHLIRQLVLDSQYVIDEAVVADAIIARANVRRLVGNINFRNDVREEEVRSFRPTRRARSFRPCKTQAPVLAGRTRR